MALHFIIRSNGNCSGVTERDEEAPTEDDEDNEDDEGALRRDMFILQHWKKGVIRTGSPIRC